MCVCVCIYTKKVMPWTILVHLIITSNTMRCPCYIPKRTWMFCCITRSIDDTYLWWCCCAVGTTCWVRISRCINVNHVCSIYACVDNTFGQLWSVLCRFISRIQENTRHESHSTKHHWNKLIRTKKSKYLFFAKSSKLRYFLARKKIKNICPS